MTQKDDQIGSADTLNDFCWLQIFNKVSIADLCNLFVVNQQFQRVSTLSFDGRYKVFHYPSDLFECLPNSGNSPYCPVDKQSYKSLMRRILCNFGHSFKSLTLKDEYGHFPIEMDVVSTYCAGTLKELRLKINCHLDCDSAQPLFGSLVKLKINCWFGFDGDATALFRGCKNLKILKIVKAPSNDGVPDEVLAIAQHYPNLNELYIYDERLNLQTMFALLKHNTHIKKLETFNYEGLKAVCLMANKMENLQELILCCQRDSPVDYINEILKLKSLKTLQLHRDAVAHVLPVIEENIAQFKETLKSLTLSPVCTYFDANLIKLAKQFPSLECLALAFDYLEDAFVTATGLQNLIATSSKLYSLAIYTHHSTWFNQNFCDSLLKIIQIRPDIKQFSLSIEGTELSSIQTPSNLLHLVNVRENCTGNSCSRRTWYPERKRDGPYSPFSRMPYF